MILKSELPEVYIENGLYRVQYKVGNYAIANFSMEFIAYDGLEYYQFSIRNKYGHVKQVSLCTKETIEIRLFKKAVSSLGNFFFTSNQKDFDAMITFAMLLKH